MIYVNFDKYGVLNHIEYNDEVIFKGNNNVNKVFVCFDGIELKPQHYLTYSALINDKDYSGNLTDLASVRTTFNGKDGYMFSIFSNLTKDAGTLKLSIRLVDRLTDAILVSGILPLIVQDSAISTYSNVNITTTQYQALLTAFDELSQTFNETNFKTINEESLFGEGNITLPTIEDVDALDTSLKEFVNDNITNLSYTDEELRNQINEQNKVIEKQDRRIKQLELASEGNILNTITEEDIGYEVNATSDSLPFAEINKIGGMTYKSDNLLNPNTFKIYHATLSNDEFTITSDVTDAYLSGSINEVAEHIFLTLPVGKYQLLSTNSNIRLSFYGNTGLDSTYTTPTTLSSESKYWGIRIRSINGTSLNGQKFKIAIYKTDIIRSDYQPYFEGLRNSAVNQVVVKGANLQKTNWSGINSTIELSETLKAGQKYTITMYVNKDKVDCGINILEHNNGANNLLFNNSYTNWAQPETGWVSFVITPIVDTNYLRINGYGITNQELQGAVLKGALVEEKKWVNVNLYKPYKEPTTYTIPTTITSIDGYGLGIDETYHNYVDFANRKFVEHNKKVVLDGSLDENWSMNIADNGNGIANFVITFASLGLPNYIRNENTDYYIANRNEQTTTQANTTSEGVYLTTSVIYVRVKSTTANSVELFRNYLANNPVEIIYAIATPIETNLSDSITDDFIIEIEANGTITFDNEYKHELPYSWTYQEKL